MTLFNAMVGALNSVMSPTVVNYIAALVILFTGFITARLVGVLSKRLLREVNLNQIITKSIGLRLSAEEILSSLIIYFIYFITVVMALNQIGATSKLLHGVTLTIIIIVCISIFIALKDFVPNIIAGVYLLHLAHYKPGDQIEFDNVKAKVIEVDLLETRLQTPDKDFLVVPNSTMLKKVLRVRR
ncbi:mechanosensitive ion channel [Candidatus Woesearchaeota archaeon]|nr:mechanosensitive ion channel [Candidatus Woesearchaeota archaeon]